MVEPVVLTDIPWKVNRSKLLDRLRIAPDSDYAEHALEMAREAEVIGRPKAIYRLAFIEERGEDYITAEGVTFQSRVMSVNLAETNRLFAQVATCGRELHVWAESLEDMLYGYWADAIKEMALREAGRALNATLTEQYALGKTARMSPGSLGDWPIREQKPLFQLLGDVEEAIGVYLTPSYLMIPNKSTSGIRFETTRDYVNCQLCPRQDCPGRRAPYEPDLYAQRYASEKGAK
jgi:hypothetical protein